MSNHYSDEECLNALRAAAERLGKSPTKREYRDLDLNPTESIVTKRFGGWNEAKREAGLAICRGGNPPKAVREEFFEHIDSPTVAYWLGFLFGDGSLLEREHGYRVQLTQNGDDLQHLRKYKQTIRAENSIVEDSGVYHVRVGNGTFAEHLMEHGFTTTKGHDGALPSLTAWPLRRGFVRGLADADGYYGAHKWTITDNNDRRLRKLQQWIPFESEIVNEDVNGKSWAYLRVSGKQILPSLYHWLFPRGTQTEPAMDRKRETALAVIEEVF